VKPQLSSDHKNKFNLDLGQIKDFFSMSFDLFLYAKDCTFAFGENGMKS